MTEQDAVDEDISMYPEDCGGELEFPEIEGPELSQVPYDLGEEEGEDV